MSAAISALTKIVKTHPTQLLKEEAIKKVVEQSALEILAQ